MERNQKEILGVMMKQVGLDPCYTGVSLFACEPPRRGREEEGRGITFLHYLGLSKAIFKVRISQDQARVLIS